MSFSGAIFHPCNSYIMTQEVITAAAIGSPVIPRLRVPHIKVCKITPSSVHLEWSSEASDDHVHLEIRLEFQNEIMTALQGPVNLGQCKIQQLHPNVVYTIHPRVRRLFRSEGGDIPDGSKPIWQTPSPNQIAVTFTTPNPLSAKDLDRITTEIFQCLVRKDVDQCLKLLNQYDSELHPEARDGYGKTMLMLAARYTGSHPELTQKLLDMGANVNATTAADKTALMYASAFGYTEVVRLLIHHGATVDRRDQGGSTSLMWASDNGHPEIVEVLLEKGADVSAVDLSGKTSLMRLASQSAGSSKVAEVLLKAGADVNKVDRDGNTALMMAALNGNRVLVETLLGHGADPALKNHFYHDALDLAKANYHERIMDILSAAIKKLE